MRRNTLRIVQRIGSCCRCCHCCEVFKFQSRAFLALVLPWNSNGYSIWVEFTNIFDCCGRARLTHTYHQCQHRLSPNACRELLVPNNRTTITIWCSLSGEGKKFYPPTSATFQIITIKNSKSIAASTVGHHKRRHFLKVFFFSVGPLSMRK